MPEPATFDTHAWVKRLQQAGVPEQQAEAHVDLLATQIEHRLVTRDHFDTQRAADREYLDHRLAELELRMIDQFTKRMVVIVGLGVAILGILIAVVP